jgi:hypothetical protein
MPFGLQQHKPQSQNRGRVSSNVSGNAVDCHTPEYGVVMGHCISRVRIPLKHSKYTRYDRNRHGKDG